MLAAATADEIQPGVDTQPDGGVQADAQPADDEQADVGAPEREHDAPDDAHGGECCEEHDDGYGYDYHDGYDDGDHGYEWNESYREW